MCCIQSFKLRIICMSVFYDGENSALVGASMVGDAVDQRNQSSVVGNYRRELPGIMSMDSANLMAFTSRDLKEFTDNFSVNNLIGNTQFGKLFRGQIQLGFPRTESRDVTVKIWDQKPDCVGFNGGESLMEEIKFLTNPSVKGHKNLVKLMGYCCEDELKAVIYDLNSLNTLQNLTFRDDLKWLQTIDVIIEIARLLEFLHSQEKPYLVVGLSSSNILLDWEGKPKLCEFSLITNESALESEKFNKYTQMFAGRIDPYFTLRRKAPWDMSSDVFCFGAILLELIAKRVSMADKVQKQDIVGENLIHVWAKREYKPSTSLVHKSFQEDWDYNAEDGLKLTNLAMHCIEFFPTNRPTSCHILEGLEALQAFRRCGYEEQAGHGGDRKKRRKHSLE